MVSQKLMQDLRQLKELFVTSDDAFELKSKYYGFTFMKVLLFDSNLEF